MSSLCSVFMKAKSWVMLPKIYWNWSALYVFWRETDVWKLITVRFNEFKLLVIVVIAPNKTVN